MARHLGLTDGQFFRLTPRKFHLLVDRHRERVEHMELLVGIIASTIANWSMGAPRKPLCAADFMPSRTSKPQPKKRLNRKQVAANVRSTLEGVIHGR